MTDPLLILINALPGIITAVFLFLGVRLAENTKRRGIDVDREKAVTVAHIEAESVSAKHLMEFLTDANIRHQADLDKLLEAREQLHLKSSEIAALNLKVQALESRPAPARCPHTTWPQFSLWQRYGIAAYRCDANGWCIEANIKLCELWGVSEGELLGGGWSAAILSAEERVSAWENWVATNKNDLPYQDTYKIRNVRTGAECLIETSAGAIYDEHGAKTGYIGIVRKVN
jgi:PAS domain S-box-containing protein